MSTTIAIAPMTISFSEQVTINGKQYGNSVPYVITSIMRVDQRIVNVTTSEMNLVQFTAGAEGPGSFDQTKVAFVRVKNLDDTNYVRLRLIDTGGETIDFKLKPKGVFVIHSNEIRCNTAGGAFVAPFSRADFLAGAADTAAVDVEIFVALTA